MKKIFEKKMFTMKNVLIIFFCFSCLFPISGYSQETVDRVEGDMNYTPPTPEVAALGKYIETPVNLYTGLPQVSVPLYTVGQKRFSVPISLSYHASGIKVEEVASRAGIGWVLNAGGMITRQVRGGGVDEQGYLYTSYDIPYFKSLTNIGTSDDIREEIYYNTTGQRDYEPDMFSFNFNGFSGSFYFDQATKTPVLTEHSPLKIEYTTSTVEFGKIISSFTITDPNGIQYLFGNNQSRSSEAIEIRGGFNKEESFSFTDYTIDSREDWDQETDQYVSSWFLKEIYDPVSEESVTFDYQNNPNVSYMYRKSEVKEIVDLLFSTGDATFTEKCPVPRSKLKQFFGKSTYDEYWVSQINFNHGKVVFKQDDTKREDLSNSHRLQSVSVYDTSDRLIKNYELFHFYSEDTSNYPNAKLFDSFPFKESSGSQIFPVTYAGKRLFLDKVYEYAISNNEPDMNQYKSHVFEYESPDEMPSRFSTAQDFWGYYNGEKSNENLIKLEYFIHNNIFYSDQFLTEQIGAADRSVDEEKCKVGSLKKITFPTGGSKEFIFESNEVDLKVDSYTLANSTKKKAYIFSDEDTHYITNDGSVERRDFRYEMNFEIKPLELAGYDFQSVTFNFDVPCDVVEGDEDSCPWKITLIDEAGTGATDIWRMFVRTGQTTYTLSAGTYRLIGERGVQYEDHPIDLTRPGNADPLFDINFITLEDKEPDTETLVGGLRIAEIKTVTDQNEMTKVYTYENTDQKPSGELLSTPYFEDISYVKACLDLYETSRVAHVSRYPYYLRQFTSNSSVPLFRTSGSYTGYRKVTEHEIGLGSGKTEYTYSFFENTHRSNFSYRNFGSVSVDPVIEDYPYSPENSLEYKRGKLLSKKVYRYENDEFVKVYEEVNTYALDLNKHTQEAIKIVPLIMNNSIATNNAVGAIRNYYLNSKVNLLTKKVTRTYDIAANTYSRDSILYIYNHETLNLIREKRFNNAVSTSTAITDIQKYYPDDVSALTSDDVTLGQRNIIENLDSNHDHRVSELVFSKVNGHQLFETKNNVFFKRWGAAGKTLMEYTQTRKDGYSDTGYTSGKILRYDDVGNPLEVQEKENGAVTSYIWGYDRSFPIAVLVNVAYADIPETTVANLQNLSSQDTDSCTGFACHEGQLRSALQQLYTNFPEGMITTYTHDPLIGVTSITDPKRYTIYYEYDAFNRLEYVRDQENNLISENKYNYKK